MNITTPEKLCSELWQRLLLCSLVVLAMAAVATVRLTYRPVGPDASAEQMIEMACWRISLLLAFQSAPPISLPRKTQKSRKAYRNKSFTAFLLVSKRGRNRNSAKGMSDQEIAYLGDLFYQEKISVVIEVTLSRFIRNPFKHLGSTPHNPNPTEGKENTYLKLIHSTNDPLPKNGTELEPKRAEISENSDVAKATFT